MQPDQGRSGPGTRTVGAAEPAANHTDRPGRGTRACRRELGLTDGEGEKRKRQNKTGRHSKKKNIQKKKRRRQKPDKLATADEQLDGSTELEILENGMT